MGKKRHKVSAVLKGFIPKTVNFSELEQKFGEDVDVCNEYGDDGSFVDKIENDVFLEQLIVQMLYILDGDEKMVFIYQLLRDNGYQIDHGSFARTLHMSRQKYMDLLSGVRMKTLLVVSGQNHINNK